MIAKFSAWLLRDTSFQRWAVCGTIAAVIMAVVAIQIGRNFGWWR